MDKENRPAKTGTTPSKNVQAFEDQVGHIGHSIVTQYVTRVMYRSSHCTVQYIIDDGSSLLALVNWNGLLPETQVKSSSRCPSEAESQLLKAKDICHHCYSTSSWN
jgi:hypothetical protein